MINHLPGAEAALVCGRDGIVLSILQDELDISRSTPPGTPLSEAIAPASRQKFTRFLEALLADGVAENWELDVSLDGESGTLLFAGVATGQTITVLAARSRSSLARTYEELVKINNEQTNMLRQAMKEQAGVARRRAEQDMELYEELSRLNNDLANAQRELAKKNGELARLNEQKNQFLGMAAHDMRNPLSLILTYADFLVDEAADALDQEQRHFIDIIKSSSRFMLGLVDDLLDVSKIEAGRLELDLQPIDLEELVGRNVTLNRTLAEAKRIEIALKEESELPAVTLDAGKIEQVLNNLIGNAIKFSEAGSTIDVTLGREASRAVIVIADHGRGMTAAELESLFTPFYQGRSAGTGGERGTGLGLVIVKRIIEGHGGSIRVDSAPGVGTTVTVSLPIAGPSPVGGPTRHNTEIRQ